MMGTVCGQDRLEEKQAILWSPKRRNGSASYVSMKLQTILFRQIMHVYDTRHKSRCPEVALVRSNLYGVELRKLT